MITADRIRTISRLAFPNTIALSSSLVMMLVDLAMVGTLGNSAVAAVGLASFSNTLILALVAGAAPAVQGLVARRRGEGSTEPKCLPLNAGLLFVLLLGVPLSLICHFLSPFFYAAISSDAEVTRIGTTYLQILFVAIVAVGVNNAFKGHWNGMERPKVFMLIVIGMNCLNIFLNYVLIFGNLGAPALGVTGAAIATVVSLHAGAIINCAVVSLRWRNEGFLTARPQRALLSRIFQMGVPATLQEFFFSAGYIVFFWIIGQVGTAELAATNVLVRVTMVLTLLAMAMGMTSATLVSKAVGQGDIAAATQWGWDSAKIGVISISLLGLPLLLAPKFFLALFLTDPATIDLATIPLQMQAATTGIASLIYILSYTLYSVGDGNRVLMISFSTQWFIFLPAVWVVGAYLDYGLLQIWFVNMFYGALATVLITAIWVDGRWKTIKL